MQKLILLICFTVSAIAGMAQDSYLHFTIDGKKYEIGAAFLRINFQNARDGGYKYSELKLSTGFVKIHGQNMMLELNFLEADKVKPSVGKFPVSDNIGYRNSEPGYVSKVPLAYFRIDFAIPGGFKHYHTNKAEDGIIEISDVKGNIFEGNFSLTLTEITSKETIQVEKGSFRIVLKE